MTAAALVCGSCGTELPPDSRFCNKCGAAVATATTPAEYKQVTVLFADVVHSMDIAAAVGAERLREIMAELVDRATAVVQRYGGTVDKFTGDGIVALYCAAYTVTQLERTGVGPGWRCLEVGAGHGAHEQDDGHHHQGRGDHPGAPPSNGSPIYL